MTRTWKYGDKEYYFDISERTCIEKITKALFDLKEDSDEVWNIADAADEVSAHCEMIEHFFDTVLGDDVVSTLFGEGGGAEACSAAYADFIMFLKAEVDSFSEISSKMDRALSLKTQL